MRCFCFFKQLCGRNSERITSLSRSSLWYNFVAPPAPGNISNEVGYHANDNLQTIQMAEIDHLSKKFLNRFRNPVFCLNLQLFVLLFPNSIHKNWPAHNTTNQQQKIKRQCNRIESIVSESISVPILVNAHDTDSFVSILSIKRNIFFR